MGLLGIFIGLGLLIILAFRGWSVLLLSPAAALVVALFSGEPPLAHWTQTFMGSASRFVAQFFSIFLLSAVFGKLMVDSGSVTTIAAYLSEILSPRQHNSRRRACRSSSHLWRRQFDDCVLRTGPDGADAVPSNRQTV